MLIHRFELFYFVYKNGLPVLESSTLTLVTSLFSLLGMRQGYIGLILKCRRILNVAIRIVNLLYFCYLY